MPQHPPFPTCSFPPGSRFAGQPVGPHLDTEQAAALLNCLPNPATKNFKAALATAMRFRRKLGLQLAPGGGYALTEMLRFIEGEADHDELLRLQRENYADGEVGS